MRFRFSSAGWGVLLLLAAALVLVNQFNDFAGIGVWSIVVAALALAFAVQCVAQFRLGMLPVPLAVLYVVFREPLELPHIGTWPLIVTAVLASVGISLLFQRRRCPTFRFRRNAGARIGNAGGADDGNNHSVSVNFGETIRTIQAERLETVRVECNFGEAKIVFEGSGLNEGGARAIIDCNFGSVKLVVPRDWRIVDEMDCSFGGLDIGSGLATGAEGAPALVLSGSVAFGGVKVRSL